MKYILIAAVMLLGATPAYAGIDLNELHGPSWNCGRLRANMPKSFRDQCAKCEAKGMHFSQDFPESFSSADPPQEELDTAKGSCVGKEDTAAVRENLRKRLGKNKSAPQHSTQKKPVWYAIAGSIWSDSKGSHVVATISATSSSKAEAEQNALSKCQESGKNCKVSTSWSRGCGYVSVGTKHVNGKGLTRMTYGTDREDVVSRCEAGGYSCKKSAGACVN